MAESVNNDNFTDQLTRAGRSIQAAVRHWNNAANWKWLATTKSDYTTSVGEDEYTLPTLCKGVHSVRMTGGTPRTLEYIGRRQLNRIMPKQDDQLLPYFYDLFNNESNNGVLRLFPIPSLAEPFTLDYYRQMIVPMDVVSPSAANYNSTTGILTLTSVTTAGITIGSQIVLNQTTPTIASLTGTVDYVTSSTTLHVKDAVLAGTTPTNLGGTIGGESYNLDIPSDYEDGIIAWATHHYLANRTGGASPKLQYWAEYAKNELDRALRNNQTDTPDQEIMLLPSYMVDTALLGPNDIRWADISW